MRLYQNNDNKTVITDASNSELRTPMSGSEQFKSKEDVLFLSTTIFLK